MKFYDIEACLYLNSAEGKNRHGLYICEREITKETNTLYHLNSGERVNKDKLDKYNFKVDGVGGAGDGYVSVKILTLGESKEEVGSKVLKKLEAFFLLGYKCTLPVNSIV